MDPLLKRCPQCERTLPRTEFYTAKHRHDGLMAHCKDCSKRMAKQWNDANPERKAEMARDWRQRNPDWYRRWYRENRERINAVKAAYRARKRIDEALEKREKRLAYQREWYRRNREEELQRQRERYAVTKGKGKAPLLVPAWLKAHVPPVSIEATRLHLLSRGDE